LLVGVAALILCLSALGWFKRVDFRQIAVDATAWYWQTMSLVWLLLLGVLAFGQ
jgi:cytochrome c oxidase subunit 3